MELIKTPYSKFKIKIFEGAMGRLTGYTNLLVKDKTGTPYPGVGRGINISDTVEDTLKNFMEILGEKDYWNEEEFEIADPYDF
jgi:hypothetical protein